MLLFVNKFCRKAEKKILHCSTWYSFFSLMLPQILPEVNTPMSDWFSRGSCSGGFFVQAHVGSKKHTKTSHRTDLPIILFSVLCTSLLFKFTVLLLQSYLLSVKSGNTTWINTTQILWFQLVIQTTQTCK